MFEAELKGNNEIMLTGRFDASQVEKAKMVFAFHQTSHARPVSVRLSWL